MAGLSTVLNVAKSFAAPVVPLIGAGMSWGGVAFSGASAFNDFRSETANGANPVLSGALNSAKFAAGMYMGILPYLLAFEAPGIAFGLGQAAIAHTDRVREMRTPFSHRFEHSDASAAAQSIGMRAIGASWGANNVAASMARRYGR